MAAHSSVLAQIIPRTEKPGGLQWSGRGHTWSWSLELRVPSSLCARFGPGRFQGRAEALLLELVALTGTLDSKGAWC